MKGLRTWSTVMARLSSRGEKGKGISSVVLGDEGNLQQTNEFGGRAGLCRRGKGWVRRLQTKPARAGAGSCRQRIGDGLVSAISLEEDS